VVALALPTNAEATVMRGRIALRIRIAAFFPIPFMVAHQMHEYVWSFSTHARKVQEPYPRLLRHSLNLKRRNYDARCEANGLIV
jgi:hypothetical protein